MTESRVSRGVDVPLSVRAVDGVTFDLLPSETLGIVGESGCGKTVTALSILGLIPKPPGEIAGGSILFKGRNLLESDEDQLQAIRGNHIAMVFQEPLTSLNPVFTIGDQIGTKGTQLDCKGVAVRIFEQHTQASRFRAQEHVAARMFAIDLDRK